MLFINSPNCVSLYRQWVETLSMPKVMYGATSNLNSELPQKWQCMHIGGNIWHVCKAEWSGSHFEWQIYCQQDIRVHTINWELAGSTSTSPFNSNKLHIHSFEFCSVKCCFYPERHLDHFIVSMEIADGRLYWPYCPFLLSKGGWKDVDYTIYGHLIRYWQKEWYVDSTLTSNFSSIFFLVLTHLKKLYYM